MNFAGLVYLRVFVFSYIILYRQELCKYANLVGIDRVSALSRPPRQAHYKLLSCIHFITY